MAQADALPAADLVDLIVRRAPELRAAGVLEIQIGDFHATLAPHREEPVAVADDEDSKAPIDPLIDPHTFGLPEGSPIPRLTHLEMVDEAEGAKGRRS